eukprot:Skav213061  [mRNA]  locus=scaffold364:550493:557908:- [translate_table: standard]
MEQRLPGMSFEQPDPSMQAHPPHFSEAPPPFECAGGPMGSPLPTAALSSRRGDEKKEGTEPASVVTLGKGYLKLYQRFLEVAPLCSKTTGRGSRSAIFPLPTSRNKITLEFPEVDDATVGWCLCVCLGLNSFWGDALFYDGDISKAQRKCLEMILVDCERFGRIEVELPGLDWADLFAVKAIDYKGDEVKVALPFRWENIAPALPSEVGSVPLEAVCTRGCLEYVRNFECYLKPSSEWGSVPTGKVIVSESEWPEVCQGLVSSGVCVYLCEDDVFKTDSGLLLNGLFGVTKDECTAEGVEIYRLIMNLIPLNRLCKPIAGDVDTLPAWSSMSPFFLQPDEKLLISSEDVKCFFYTMSVPPSWYRFLAFNRPVPDHALPSELRGHRHYLASRVLPMGFLNSVSLAQHVHRNLVSWSSLSSSFEGTNAPEEELRKDQSFSVSNPNWRVYLDNYDLLERAKATEVDGLEGSTAAGVLALRHQYEQWGVPRNMKKAVERKPVAELQGATVDGHLGVAFPKESKLAKYFVLTMKLAEQKLGSQKQWQVACGGLVYFCMFRRAILGSLNQVWRHILSFDRSSSRMLPTPLECKLELLRCLSLLPLARLDFRLPVHEVVTCSDASSSGGGICASIGLTSLGGMAAGGSIRGELPEFAGDNSVVAIGLFDGIGALRVALEIIGVKVLGYVSVEPLQAARRVVESHFPGVIHVDSVEEVDEHVVSSWACRFSQCSMVVVGAGPPCQGVSGLNSDRKGALRDCRSSLFAHVPRIRSLVQKAFPWAAVHSVMESVSSMDASDRDIMSEGFGDLPLHCDAGCFTPCSRPRLYWLSWDIVEGEGIAWDRSGCIPVLLLQGGLPWDEVLRRGWSKVDESRPFPTFTTSRPRDKAGRKPAGVHSCDLEELERWHKDAFRFPPYQYRRNNCLVNGGGEYRLPDPEEREAMLGFPVGYTLACASKTERKRSSVSDVRLTLLGNTWSVPVVGVLLSHLFAQQGWIRPLSPQDVLNSCRSGTHSLVQGRLVRLPLNPERCRSQVDQQVLATKDQRQRLGSLRELTVQPATRRRYQLATQAFFDYLDRAGVPIPTQRLQFDGLVCDFLVHLWATGAGRGQANDTIAGLQDLQPSLRNRLPGAWRLMKTWSINEVPARAAPLPEHVLQAMAGWAFFKGYNSFGVSLVLAFYTMLRTGEVLSLRSSHLLCGPDDKQAVISLGMTKGGKRRGAAESVILGHEPGVFLVKAWKQKAVLASPFCTSAKQWRSRFNEPLGDAADQSLRLWSGQVPSASGELGTDDQPGGPGVDVFSYAMVIYEIVCREVPFEEEAA